MGLSACPIKRLAFQQVDMPTQVELAKNVAFLLLARNLCIAHHQLQQMLCSPLLLDLEDASEPVLADCLMIG